MIKILDVNLNIYEGVCNFPNFFWYVNKKGWITTALLSTNEAVGGDDLEPGISEKDCDEIASVNWGWKWVFHPENSLISTLQVSVQVLPPFGSLL